MGVMFYTTFEKQNINGMKINFDKLRVKQLAFASAEAPVFDSAKRKYTRLFNPEQVEFVNDRPDVLLFLTGGSERMAVESVQEYRFYLLLASKDGNSWAAATEVKAWMNLHNITSVLVDVDSEVAPTIIAEFYSATRSVRRLRGQRLGVVGAPSDWLVASSISSTVLRNRLGIDTVDISWDDILIDEIDHISPSFVEAFSCAADKGELRESGKLYEGLASLIPFFNLNALSVECFPTVKETGHSVCLALSMLNSEGVPAACEADNVSAVGMMFANEVCGVVPWMANIAHVTERKAKFTHCAVPLNLLSGFKVDTHYETGRGQAVQGDFAGDEVTIFRFSSTFDKMFVTSGAVLNRPKSRSACRTQLEVALTDTAFSYFTENPFGNHHLIIPGNKVKVIKLAAMLLQVGVVE